MGLFDGITKLVMAKNIEALQARIKALESELKYAQGYAALVTPRILDLEQGLTAIADRMAKMEERSGF